MSEEKNLNKGAIERPLQAVVRLPTYQDAKRSIEQGNPTLLERFVYEWEPSDSDDEKKFREALLRLLQEKAV